MKPKVYQLLMQCIEDGVEFGYHRASKHTDTPSDDDIKQSIIREIDNQICEWFDFEVRE